MKPKEIKRKPEDCEFDLNEVLTMVERQNKLGNQLKEHVIQPEKVILTFE